MEARIAELKREFPEISHFLENGLGEITKVGKLAKELLGLRKLRQEILKDGFFVIDMADKRVLYVAGAVRITRRAGLYSRSTLETIASDFRNKIAGKRIITGKKNLLFLKATETLTEANFE